METAAESPTCLHTLPTVRLQDVLDNGNRLRFRCPDCNQVLQWFVPQNGEGEVRFLSVDLRGVSANGATAKSATPKPAADPAKGLAGTEMLLLTAELGIEDKPGCGCKNVAAMMDQLGVEGCRQRYSHLLLMIQTNYAAWGWQDRLHNATKAAWKAVGLGVNPVDPIASLLNLAIDRAEAKMAEILQATA